jgi:hypothetical protein
MPPCSRFAAFYRALPGAGCLEFASHVSWCLTAHAARAHSSPPPSGTVNAVTRVATSISFLPPLGFRTMLWFTTSLIPFLSFPPLTPATHSKGERTLPAIFFRTEFAIKIGWEPGCRLCGSFRETIRAGVLKVRGEWWTFVHYLVDALDARR